jgi:putative addiction module component (TIGR02574 family)
MLRSMGTKEVEAPSASEVLKQALGLDEKDRASVAWALIASLEREPDLDAEAAWDAEIRRRVEELDSGAVRTIPWSEVRKHLFRGSQ